MDSNSSYDVIVIGVGGMGSATAYHLARRGQDVLGLERFDIPHEMGSSHGITRIIRRAYYEHPSYVPLLNRAYELWDELEATHHRQLFYPTGSIDAGPEDGEVFGGSLRSCEDHDLTHEVLTAEEVTERYPGYHLPDDHMALFQPDGGFLVPEQCIVAHVEQAHAHGADIHARERVIGWETTSGGVTVTTDRAEYAADSLVITAGAWTSTLVPDLEERAVPERQVLAWLQPTVPEYFTPDAFPVFNLEVEAGRYYGFPVFDVPGFKFGRYHHRDERVDPDDLPREPTPDDEALLRSFAERYFPDGAGPTMRLATCMFTNSPDEHFILDRISTDPTVVVGAGFSGHGFKFASVVGEVLADLTLTGDTDHDISMFELDRFD